MLLRSLLLLSFLVGGFSCAQVTHQVNGVYDKNYNYHVFVNAVIHQDYKTKISNATLIIRGDKVVDVGKALNIPSGSVVHDLKGKHIYPSFIDMYSSYGMSQNRNAIQQNANDRYPQRESNKKGAYNWNQAIHPEVDAVEILW